MRLKLLPLLSLMALAAAALHGQPTNGGVYWSTVAPDCTTLAGESAVAITNSSGTTIGYSCYVSGTFVWLAAGGGWVTSLSVAAPTSAAVGVDYSFYDAKGNNLEVDTTPYGSSVITSGSSRKFALSANQSADINLQGATADAPKYASTASGSVYAVFYCPDAQTCANLAPQLFYVALSATPWVLSAPIAWDTALWTQWSTQGVDDGGANRISLAICNEDTTAASYTVRVYDSTGTLTGTGTTPPIPPLQSLSNGSYGEGGTYAALLSDLIPTRLPAGVFKILIDGGSKYSAVEVLQFSGTSATALQVVYDSAPGSTSSSTLSQRNSLRRARVESTPKVAFGELTK
ncbi:MAG: hypothetical protein U0Q18_26425 [Bryobacteraceae bacterium]